MTNPGSKKKILPKYFSAYYKIENFIYLFHKSTTIFFILRQNKLGHNSPSNFLYIHFNIILPSTGSSSPVVSIPQVSPPKPSMHLSYPCTPVPHAPPISFFTARTILRNEYCCRSQWPRGLRRRSASTCLLRLWVRIPPGAWMFGLL